MGSWHHPQYTLFAPKTLPNLCFLFLLGIYYSGPKRNKRESLCQMLGAKQGVLWEICKCWMVWRVYKRLTGFRHSYLLGHRGHAVKGCVLIPSCVRLTSKKNKTLTSLFSKQRIHEFPIVLTRGWWWWWWWWGGWGGVEGWKRRGLVPRNGVAKRSRLRGGQRIIAVFFSQ